MIMKNIFKILALLVVFCLPIATVHADAVYPITNPGYIPMAISPAATYTAPASYVLTTHNIGTTSVRVSGTCTSLAAVMQGSNDGGTNYTTINLYPIATGTTAPVAVASISAAGFWKANTVGYNKVRLSITALTASCRVVMAGHMGGFNGTNF
jgi:hypothetical protein